MSHFPTRWNTLAILLALATMVGCQGVSTSSKSAVSLVPGQVTPASASVSFGSVPVGTSKTMTDTVTNTGGASITVTQATVTGTGYSISGVTVPLTLGAGQSATVSVVFAPATAGTVSGNIALTTDDGSAVVTLSGTGTAEQSQGALSVTPVNVGSVVDGTSGSQTGTLSATGASVSVSSVSLSGTNPSEFSISGLSFPVTVTTTQPVTFTVNFTPGATGTASATASFASNASSSPSSASLTGTGTAAPVHTVSLSWTASTTTGVTSYNVYRAIFGTSCGSYSNIGSTPNSSTAYTDSVVADGTTYCYATTAVDPSGESTYSNVAKALIPAP